MCYVELAAIFKLREKYCVQQSYLFIIIVTDFIFKPFGSMIYVIVLTETYIYPEDVRFYDNFCSITRGRGGTTNARNKIRIIATGTQVEVV